MSMWKIVVAFVVFAALAMYMLSRGDNIDMSGEKHGGDAAHVEPAAAVAASAPTSAPVPAASAAASAPALSASK